MSDNMNNFFDNLSSIADHLERMVEGGEPLPDEAAAKVSEFNERIQQLEYKSANLKCDKMTIG